MEEEKEEEDEQFLELFEEMEKMKKKPKRPKHMIVKGISIGTIYSLYMKDKVYRRGDKTWVISTDKNRNGLNY